MALLTRWNPFGQLWEEMTRFQQEVEEAFDRWGFGFRSRPMLAVSFPPLNVWEDEEHVFAEAELPGMKLEDLEIYVTGCNQLTLKGQRSLPDVQTGTWHRQERPSGAFTRMLTLPVDVDADKVEAKLENGVLTIKMPKRESAKPKRIAIKCD
jgi:HSP20 family protein